VQLRQVDESELQADVYAFLRASLVGGEPEHAFDLLNHWLYLASERRERIAHGSFATKIGNVGRYLADRATYHQEWFTSIVPIEDAVIPDIRREPLTQEFYEGIPARYEHILLALDVVRHDRLHEIEARFQDATVVIIHGASGQGKTTLAYRYLHDFVPELWRFEVRLIEDRQHAVRIARALSGHANAVSAPMVVFVDVAPRDADWPDLIRELAQNENLRVLVAIREEDWRRASTPHAGFPFGTVELTFDEEEAHRLYPNLASIRTPDRFLSFEDAWRRFGSGGPLLEFVYLVTQDASLRERLRDQVRRLQDWVRVGKLHPSELGLLRIVSVASAYGARVHLKTLLEQLQLTNPIRTLELFEREYLVRRSRSDQFVEGLHPIRSAILVDLLTDPVVMPWSDVASTCLPLLAEQDTEIFLLHAFSRRTDAAQALTEVLLALQPETWTGLGGIVRALLWLGVRQYVAENEGVILEAFERLGPAWTFALDFDIASVANGLAASWWKDMDVIPNQMKVAIEELQARQTTKAAAFAQVERWLAQCGKQPAPPTTLSDWAAMAEAGFWAGQLAIDCRVLFSLDEADLDRAIDTLPLEQLGDVVLGLKAAWTDRFHSWLDENQARILRRFRRETQTVVIENGGKTIRAHFILDLQHLVDTDGHACSASDPSRNRPHHESLRRVHLLSKLAPNRDHYGCQGYGHRLGMLSLPFDDTDKPSIPANSLAPGWPVRINSLFRGLGIYALRPSTWLEHAETVLQLRETVACTLRDLQRALCAHFRKQKPTKLLGDYISIEEWRHCQLITGGSLLLPKCAVDEWGFTTEGIANPRGTVSESDMSRQTREALAFWEHRPYLSALRDFTFSLSNFYRQSTHVLALNPALGRTKSAKARESVLQAAVDQGVRTDFAHLSTYNLAEALSALPAFQREFKRRFSHFVDVRSLDTVEKRERDVFSRGWALWYHFAHHPNRTWRDAEHEALSRIDKVLGRVRRDIRRGFRQLSTEGIDATILSEQLPWEGQPALWITFDVHRPVELYTSFDSVLEILKSAMAVSNDSTWKGYALDLRWGTVVIVPLARSKSLNKMAWRMTTSVLASGRASGGKDWWNYVQRPVSPEDWTRSGLPAWESERLQMATTFQSALIELSLLVAHLCDLTRLPAQTDDLGQTLLQEYLTRQSQSINEAFQRALDQAAELLRYFESLTEEQRESRPPLIAAMRTLGDMTENLAPSPDFDGEQLITLSTLVDWMPRLETARLQAELVYLLWATDCLDRSG